MVWHILAIVFGALTIAAFPCPSPCSNIVLGILVVIFASLALRSFRKMKGSK